VGPCHHGMARPRVAAGGDDRHMWRLAATILRGQPTWGGPPAPGFGLGPTTSHGKRKLFSYEMLHRASNLDGFFG
jgi:hypothetical protein